MNELIFTLMLAGSALIAAVILSYLSRVAGMFLGLQLKSRGALIYSKNHRMSKSRMKRRDWDFFCRTGDRISYSNAGARLAYSTDDRIYVASPSDLLHNLVNINLADSKKTTGNHKRSQRTKQFNSAMKKIDDMINDLQTQQKLPERPKNRSQADEIWERYS
jgi:hypothetical protein